MRNPKYEDESNILNHKSSGTGTPNPINHQTNRYCTGIRCPRPRCQLSTVLLNSSTVVVCYTVVNISNSLDHSTPISRTTLLQLYYSLYATEHWQTACWLQYRSTVPGTCTSSERKRDIEIRRKSFQLSIAMTNDHRITLTNAQTALYHCVRLGFTLLTSAPTSQYWCLHVQRTVIQYYSTTVT